MSTQVNPSTAPIGQTVRLGSQMDSLSLAVVNDAGLFQLPNELLLEIINFGVSGVDLCCLRQTCRRFAALVSWDDVVTQIVSTYRNYSTIFQRIVISSFMLMLILKIEGSERSTRTASTTIPADRIGSGELLLLGLQISTPS